MLAGVAWFGFQRGSRSYRPRPAGKPIEAGPVDRFRVDGSSMVPTLLGPSLRAKCPQCKYEFMVDEGCWDRASEPIVCSLCGASQSVTELGTAAKSFYPGDVINVWPAKKRGYHRGDMVAFRANGQLQVKRIVAVGGEVVSTQQGRLLVGGKRIEDLLSRAAFPAAELIVDEDNRRDQSRWVSGQGRRPWKYGAGGRWNCNDREETPWLSYHHRSVHHHNQPGGVMDDYQYNAAVARRLNEVDRLTLSGGVLTTGNNVKIELAFWTRDGNVLINNRNVPPGGEFRLSVWDGVPADDLPVTQQQPIAIRFFGDAVTVFDLKIMRSVEFRLRDSDDAGKYPITIPAGHYFLLGDNVPFSIDSRSFGSIDGKRMLGIVPHEHPSAWGR